MPNGDPYAVVVGHDDLDVVLRAHRHLQAAEVDPLPRRECLPRVPRAAVGPRSLGGPFILGRLVIELIIGQPLVTGLRPIPANVC